MTIKVEVWSGLNNDKTLKIGAQVQRMFVDLSLYGVPKFIDPSPLPMALGTYNYNVFWATTTYRNLES